MDSVSFQSFSFESKEIEEQIVKSFVQQAREYKGVIYANVLASRLCDKAFETFKKKLREKFPDQGYANLISLTLKARTNRFFISLEQDLQQIFKEKLTISS